MDSPSSGGAGKGSDILGGVRAVGEETASVTTQTSRETNPDFREIKNDILLAKI